MKVPVGIVDDKSQNLQRLNYSDDIAIVLTASGGSDFLDQMEKLPRASHPLVILMDIAMPDLEGIETVRVAKLLFPHIHFLMLTDFEDDDNLFEAIRAGADGYLLKNDKLASIIDCIVQLSESGSAPMSPPIARKTLDVLTQTSLPDREKDYALSEREMEILRLTIDGYAINAIAEKLFLSTHTIGKHLANIYTKLHVQEPRAPVK
jgi:DNA-binding NarL/FixJ family response regulator